MVWHTLDAIMGGGVKENNLLNRFKLLGDQKILKQEQHF